MGRVFTIPPEVPFLDALAAGLLAEGGGDPAGLARATILLPTRRAVRAMAEAFLRASEGHALLLPRLVPVGDLDADELALLSDEGDGGGIEIAPAAPDLRRRLMLTRLVLRWGRVAGSGPLAPGQAAPLAASLAAFLDEVQAAGGTLDDLERLVPDEHAEHWQKVIQFLDILRLHWPDALAEIACLDPGDRRNRVLAAQIEEWRRAPPAHPVIAAGITGGVPAVADLVAAVAALPMGRVVLPGLARDAAPDDWDAISLDPTHPQHLLVLLLDRLDLDPAEVHDWPHEIRAGSPAERRKLVFEALRPAETSGRWRAEPVAPQAIEGLHRIDCPGAQEEALVIALLLRETLEKPGETAALITPDRDLARRVAAELRRWRIEIDDSAGVPLHHTPPGVFLRLILAAVAEAMAPVPLLALLKHPLAACGLAPESCRALARELEDLALRGPRPEPGFVGLRARLGEKKNVPRALFRFLAAVEAALAPLIEALAAKDAGLGGLVAAHLAASEALARSDSDSGAQRLWREPAGEAAAQLMSELLDAASSFEPLDGADYPALFAALSSGPVVRPPYGHPRLFIWGLLEARLQHADRVVLGGLNEGTWPRGADPDPWLSRPMRQNFGLPPPERRTGVAAHDFAQAMGAREVFLTRAARVEGTPTVPSRWLLRLDAVLADGKLDGQLMSSTALAWARHVDEAERIAIAEPAPRPPVAVRPRRLSVTEIEAWMRDPYAVYARHVLGLKALEKLAADPGPRERGIYIHKALDLFLKAHPAALPADARERLLSFGREAFGAALERPFVRAFWWPRFVRIAEWFVAEEALRRARIGTIAAECKGSLVFDAPYAPFELYGRADRVDRLASGGLAVIDFKTGGVPSGADISLGFSPQLPLEAAIAEAGGFAGLPAAAVEELAFWQLSGRDPAGRIKDVADTPSELRQRIADALRGLQSLAARFDDGATPYRSTPRPEKAPRYSDYGHLARIKEWSVASEGEA